MGLKEEVIFRTAKPEDLDQLIDLTIESFNGSNGRSFYESLFDIDRAEYKKIVRNIFNQNISSNEYDVNSYFVLSKGKEVISCLAGWKECEDGIESERLLPTVLLQHVGVERWLKKNDVIKRIAELNLARDGGKIQIENMYLKKEYRGTSAFFKIYFKTVNALYERYPECNIVQSRFFASNRIAIRIAKHIGYEIVGETSFDDQLINPYFPNEGLVMTELEKAVFYSKNKINDREYGK